MHPSRPDLERHPCPACGAPVDPLRAPRALAVEKGVVTLCGDPCVDRLRARTAPSQQRRSARPPSSRPPGPRIAHRRLPTPAMTSVVDLPPATPLPSVALAAACLGLGLGFVPGSLLATSLGALANVAAAAAALPLGVGHAKRYGMLVWLAAPVGTLLASIAAVLAASAGSTSIMPAVGAGVAALCTVIRAYLDGRTFRPVAEAVNGLTAPIPRRARAPVRTQNALELSEEEIPTDRVRAGEEVLALRGDIVAVDGVVKGGEAEVLLYASSKVPVRRVPGDPVLAGARVAEGALRLMAARVGDDRALFRPLRFGQGSGPGAARVARIAEQIARVTGISAVAIAVLSFGAFDAGGAFAQQVAAGAAVLLAAPLLATRRAAEAPLVAAAAAAAGQGMIFHDARTLEAAGSVTSCVLCTHGIVTEGAPEVVEVHPIGNADVRALMALAAAAHTAAEGSAIARAIRRYAERHGIAPESVRRAIYTPGRGVTALGAGSEPLVIGNRQLLIEEGVSVALADEEAMRAEAQGYTAIFVGLGGRVRAVISLQDEIRPGARAAVQRIVDLSVEPVLLSGDHRATVEAIARNLDVTHVKAELLPEERGPEVLRLAEAGGRVAVVGHPRRDDAALAAASVPIVLKAAGGPLGDRGVALATDDLRDAAGALWVARVARTTAFQNLIIASTVGGLAILAAAFHLIGPIGAALIGLSVDLMTLPTGERLLRRIERRHPGAG